MRKLSELQNIKESLKSKHQLRVEKMMSLIPQEVPERPKQLDQKTAALRISLMLSEVLETARDAGVSVLMYVDREEPIALVDAVDKQIWETLEYVADGEFDLVKYVDGCCDTIVTATGSLSAAGIPDDAALTIVDNNNLQKFGPGSFVDDMGKLNKPPGFVGPEKQLTSLIEDLTRSGQAASADVGSEHKPKCGGSCAKHAT